MSNEEILAANLERNREWARRVDERAAQMVAAGQYPDVEAARLPASHEVEAERQQEGNAARAQAESSATFDPPAAGTFGEYLLRHAGNGISEHKVGAHIRGDGRVYFYVHPIDRAGEPMDFIADGNAISPLRG